jgi:predicted membrane protein
MLDDIKSELGLPSDEGCLQGCLYKLLAGLGKLAVLCMAFGIICLTTVAAVDAGLLSTELGVLFGILAFVGLFALDLSMRTRMLNFLGIVATMIIFAVLLILINASLISNSTAILIMIVFVLVVAMSRGFFRGGTVVNTAPGRRSTGQPRWREEMMREVEQDREVYEQQQERAHQQEVADDRRATAEWVENTWRQDE